MTNPYRVVYSELGWLWVRDEGREPPRTRRTFCPALQHSADRRMSSAASPPPAGRPAGPPAEAANYLGPISATPHYVVSAMLHLAKANANTVVFDLGCSDGRVPIAAARDHGVKSAVGYEISEVAYARSIAALAS